MPDQDPYTYQAWPAWAEGPDGEREIFNSEAEVPKGWKHHVGATAASAVALSATTTPVQVQNAVAAQQAATGPVGNDQTTPAVLQEAQAGPVGGEETAKRDKAGTPFDPARHTGTMTKAGLWRMKVGVSRPESESKPLDAEAQVAAAAAPKHDL